MATIKFSNGVTISKESIEGAGTLVGVDTSRVIASQVGLNTNYVAPEDC